jgi:hypothetical protein
MKRLVIAIGLLAAFGARPGWAQSADECVLSALNIAEAKYPCLYADHRALFRVVAPDAQKVRGNISGTIGNIRGVSARSSTRSSQVDAGRSARFSSPVPVLNFFSPHLHNCGHHYRRVLDRHLSLWQAGMVEVDHERM